MVKSMGFVMVKFRSLKIAESFPIDQGAYDTIRRIVVSSKPRGNPLLCIFCNSFCEKCLTWDLRYGILVIVS